MTPSVWRRLPPREAVSRPRLCRSATCRVGDTGIEPVTSSVSGIPTVRKSHPLSTKTVPPRMPWYLQIRPGCHSLCHSPRRAGRSATTTDNRSTLMSWIPGPRGTIASRGHSEPSSSKVRAADRKAAPRHDRSQLAPGSRSSRSSSHPRAMVEAGRCRSRATLCN